MKHEDWKKYAEVDMVDQAWKQFERWVCKLFGGERDWEHPEECRDTDVFAPEAKYRKKLPKWLMSMVTQAESQARQNQIPFVVLTEHRMNRMQSLVIMRLQDFYDWYVADIPDDVPADMSNQPALPGFEDLVSS